VEGFGRACVLHRWMVVVGWLLVVVVLNVAGGAFAGPVRDDFALPGSESQRAADVLEDAGFEQQAGTQAQVVLHRESGLDGAGVQQEVSALVADVRRELPAAEVVSPFDVAGRSQVSRDGDTAYVAVSLPTDDPDEVAEARQVLEERATGAEVPGLEVEVGGLAVDEESDEGPPSEMIGILAALVVLVVAFGSLFAMAMPIVVGIVGAGCGLAVVALGANLVDMPSFAAPVAGMIAIGVGIDYALLVVTRFREGVRSGLDTMTAVGQAQATAGRSVLFAGGTVVIASLGLVMMDLKLITGVALGIAASVLVTMLASLTLLPALLGLVSSRIDRYGLPHRHEPGGEGTFARGWSRRVQRRPAAFALASVAVLGLLTLPALDMRLGFGDAGTRPESDTARQAYDLVAEGFGPGVNGPLVMAVEVPATAPAGAVRQLVAEVGAEEGVASTSPAFFDESGTVAVVQVVPTTGPRAEETTELVHRLREDVVPAAVAGSGVDVSIGGMTAATVDFADYNAHRLPLFLAVVLGLSFLLLAAVFRGLLVAVKAVVVNLLSLGAAFGAVVAVFQWGWGVDLLRLEASGPVEAWAPMMMVAIVFGLSMDYEVFLLSRIKEYYDAGLDNASAVAEGLARTARVITAAAAIMVCVFGSFVLGTSRELQLFGFGLATAVLVDATLVRMVLVPATMELLGDRNWWLPDWLSSRLPRVTVEPMPGDGLPGAGAAVAVAPDGTQARQGSGVSDRVEVDR
jgi:putative drug exporter of the RND superfamily